MPGKGLQVGISVSKKLGKAVRRNLIKRRLRECGRMNLSRMRPGRYVVVAREGASGATFGQLKASLENLLERGKHLR
jgi:ribonuclease P protein component